MEEKGLYLLSCLKKLKNKIKSIRQPFWTCWISGDKGQYSLRCGTKEVSPVIAPALLPGDSLQAEGHREGNPNGAQWMLSQVEKTKLWEFREAKLARFTMQPIGEERDSEREKLRDMQRILLKPPVEDSLVHVCKETTQRLGKGPSEWMGRNNPQSSHRLRTVLVPSSQTGKPHNSGSCRTPLHPRTKPQDIYGNTKNIQHPIRQNT